MSAPDSPKFYMWKQLERQTKKVKESGKRKFKKNNIPCRMDADHHYIQTNENATGKLLGRLQWKTLAFNTANDTVFKDL